MKIANPLYDYAFKCLMSNNKLAKKVLSTILEQEVIELELAQQEIIVEDEIRHFTLYRLDFKAKIRDAEGKEELVLIELQKSKLPTNELRFRNYLGLAYAQKKNKRNADTSPQIEALPIIAIYIMGYKLPDIPVMAVSVDRKIINASTKEELDIKSDFIELLTHKCYILQVRRLPEKRRTRLEQFMTLFNQAWISEDNYILDLEEVPEAFADIAAYLHRPLEDEKMIQQLVVEEEIEFLFADQEAAIEKAKQEALAAKVQAEEAERRAEKANTKAEEAKNQAKEERKAKEEAKHQAQATKIKLAQKMLKYGESIEDIITETGLDRAVIMELKV